MAASSGEIRRFEFRRLVALALLGSGAIASLTGVVLFFAPEWRAAGLLHWKFLGLTKGQHDDLHVISSGVFLLAGLAHVFIHLRALVEYLRRRIRALMAPSYELLAAACLVLLLTWGTLANWKPISALLDFAENFRNSYVMPK
ncbi:MAG: DUF4405 domain-containing protein [Spirochaetes bacterium]|nr:DUF4405 domain-containing protein [Spirochaetota bacterium]